MSATALVFHSHRYGASPSGPLVPGATPSQPSRIDDRGGVKASCIACAMRPLCVPTEAGADVLQAFERCVHSRRRISAGQYLYRTGDRGETFYAVRCGFLKALILTDDGREQTTGFLMMGDLVGVETIAGAKYGNDVIALEETHVCEISIESISRASRGVPMLQKMLFSLMEREIRRERSMMLLLGTLRAEERLAWFLLDLGRRYAARGCSSSQFLLRMSRADIGSYLGLRLETVSRMLSKLQKERILRVSNKAVEILDPGAIRSLISGGDDSAFRAFREPRIPGR